MHKPAVRFRIDFGCDAAVGPGKIALLEQIERGGSLSQAARELHMSYRRAWQLLASLNRCFLERVAVTAKGGRGVVSVGPPQGVNASTAILVAGLQEAHGHIKANR
jgi:molybdenum-dependent DNA-binding transcriptional regulator ModE